MNYDEMKGRFTHLNKLIEAAEAEKAPDEFVNKLIAERTLVKWEMINHLNAGLFESEYPANFS